MSIESMALVLHHSTAKGVDKLVLLGIANHEGDGGAYPAVPTLARYANASDRTVQRAIRTLTAAGELAVFLQAGRLPGLKDWEQPNRYEVLVTCPPTCDGTKNHKPRRLPTAPAHLWTDPVTPTSPGDTPVTGGVTPTSPPPVTQVSPKPSIEPDTVPNVCESLTESRASAVCDICGLDPETCVRRARVSGHTYQARR